MFPRLALKRLIVFRNNHVAYDELFHDGINILHSETNSCGKSSILDFIFFALGGEVGNWKEYAGRCNLVYAEVLLNDATVTLRRETSAKNTPIYVYFGDYAEAQKMPLENWQKCPLRRQNNNFSFTEVMFKALGIPQIKGSEDSNITMHQLLRVLYVDQMTSVQRIFRVEDFDPPITRQAIGNLICGIGGYNLFEKQIELRSVDKEYNEVRIELSAMIKAANAQEIQTDLNIVEKTLSDLEAERTSLYSEIQRIPEEEIDAVQKQAQQERKKSADELAKIREGYVQKEQDLKTLDYEIKDNEEYISFLNLTLDQLEDAETAARHLDSLRFQYCPACFQKISPSQNQHDCHVCKEPVEQDKQAAKLVQIKLDTQLQLRESLKIQKERRLERSKLQTEIRHLSRGYKTKSQFLHEFASSPYSDQESSIAKLHQGIGAINNRIETLERDLDVVRKINELSALKEELNTKITNLKDEISRIELAQKKRSMKVYEVVSANTRDIIKLDLPIQENFINPQSMDFSFEKDTISLDEQINFSASSNVVLKNSFMLGLFLTSLQDNKFFLPRFMMFDNIEGMGMTEDRSRNFQRIMKGVSEDSNTPHQIILTTSMIDSTLDDEKYIVGEQYSPENKTLK